MVDVKNAYLQAPCSKKYYTRLGPEFGAEFKGRFVIIIRVAYGLKCAGADYRNHIRDCRVHLGNTSYPADHGVWMR